MAYEVNAASGLGDLDTIFDEAGLKNAAVREYVRHWAELTTPSRVEVIGAADDERLIAESLAAGEIPRPARGATTPAAT